MGALERYQLWRGLRRGRPDTGATKSPAEAGPSLAYQRAAGLHREQFLKLAYEWAQAAELRASLQSKLLLSTPGISRTTIRASLDSKISAVGTNTRAGIVVSSLVSCSRFF